MANVQKVPLKIPQGTTYLHTFSYVTAAGAVVNLSGYSARMQARDTVDATAKLYDSTTLGDITVDGANGTVTLKIPASVTAAWTWRSAVYDIEIVSGTGEVTRLVEGQITVLPEVTR